MKQNILFIGATHGDEPIGVEALKQLQSEQSNFEWIIGNPEAYKRGSRTFEGDLNRSAPGNPDSDIYEVRRAAEIIAQAQSYDTCIDLHGSGAYCGIFIILGNPKKENIELAKRFNIQNVVFWPAFRPDLKGPLSECFPCGLEIESGPKQMPLVRHALVQILRDFLDGKPRVVEQKFYEVYDALQAKDTGASGRELEEFKEVTVNGETFTPLLINRYQNQKCFKMKPWTLDA